MKKLLTITSLLASLAFAATAQARTPYEHQQLPDRDGVVVGANSPIQTYYLFDTGEICTVTASGMNCRDFIDVNYGAQAMFTTLCKMSGINDINVCENYRKDNYEYEEEEGVEDSPTNP